MFFHFRFVALLAATVSFSTHPALAVTPAEDGSRAFASTDVTIPPGLDSTFAFRTLPGGHCILGAPGVNTTLSLNADDRGVALIHVIPQVPGAKPTASIFARCQSSQRSATVTLLHFRVDARAQVSSAKSALTSATPLLPYAADPATLTDTDLKRLDVPPRPDKNVAPRAYAAWLHAVNSPLQRIARTSMQHRGLSQGTIPAKNGAAQPATNAPVKFSANLSGMVDFGAPGRFSAVMAEWRVPPVTTIAAANPAYSAISTGLGGFGSIGAVRNGTEQDAWLVPGFGIVASYFAWYQTSPDNGATQIFGFPIGPGDFVYSESWLCRVAGQLGGCYFMVDYTTRIATPIEFEATPFPLLFNGNSAEWILDRPTVGGIIQPLASFGAVFMTDQFAWDAFAPGLRPECAENSFAMNMVGRALLSTIAPVNCNASIFTWHNFL